ncbi:hypothetical protein BJX62DRAFT_186873 [Aspergillus germanicus]
MYKLFIACCLLRLGVSEPDVLRMFDRLPSDSTGNSREPGRPVGKTWRHEKPSEIRESLGQIKRCWLKKVNRHLYQASYLTKGTDAEEASGDCLRSQPYWPEGESCSPNSPF